MIGTILNLLTPQKNQSSENVEAVKPMPILEEIENLNRINKDYFESDSHHKNVLKMFIPYSYPTNRWIARPSFNYNKDYVEEKLNIWMEYIKERRLFIKGHFERTEEGVYCAFLLNKVWIEIWGEWNGVLFELGNKYAKEHHLEHKDPKKIKEVHDIIRQKFNKQWYMAKVSQQRLMIKYHELRNSHLDFNDGREESVSKILYYAEHNMCSYEEQQKDNKHLNTWNPKIVQEMQQIFVEDDFSVPALDNINYNSGFVLV